MSFSDAYIREAFYKNSCSLLLRGIFVVELFFAEAIQTVLFRSESSRSTANNRPLE